MRSVASDTAALSLSEYAVSATPNVTATFGTPVAPACVMSVSNICVTSPAGICATSVAAARATSAAETCVKSVSVARVTSAAACFVAPRATRCVSAGSRPLEA
eukprot:6196070-Pleurochrysis_carterae.AAC.1